MAALQPPETTEAQKQKEKDKEELILPDYKDKIKKHGNEKNTGCICDLVMLCIDWLCTLYLNIKSIKKLVTPEK